MIAICPTCHDAVHHGTLRIDDPTLYAWKQIRRTTDVHKGSFYIERGSQHKMLLGSVSVTSKDALTVFDLGPESYVKLLLKEQELTLVDVKISTHLGVPLLRLNEWGHFDVVKDHPDVDVEIRAGRISVQVPCEPAFVPGWLISKIFETDPSFLFGKVDLFTIEVVGPGLVRVSGIFVGNGVGARVTESALHLFWQTRDPLTIRGDGENTVLVIGSKDAMGPSTFLQMALTTPSA